MMMMMIGSPSGGGIQTTSSPRRVPAPCWRRSMSSCKATCTRPHPMRTLPNHAWPHCSKWSAQPHTQGLLRGLVCRCPLAPSCRCNHIGARPQKTANYSPILCMQSNNAAHAQMSLWELTRCFNRVQPEHRRNPPFVTLRAGKIVGVLSWPLLPALAPHDGVQCDLELPERLLCPCLRHRTAKSCWSPRTAASATENSAAASVSSRLGGADVAGSRRRPPKRPRAIRLVATGLRAPG